MVNLMYNWVFKTIFLVCVCTHVHKSENGCIVLSVGVCVCGCMRAHRPEKGECPVLLCVCVCGSMRAHIGQRRVSVLFYPSPYSFETGSLTEPKARLAQQAPVVL